MAHVEDPKYYYLNHKGRWRVQKNINKRVISYGTYATEEEAKWVVEKLKECGWDKNQFWKIRYELRSREL